MGSEENCIPQLEVFLQFIFLRKHKLSVAGKNTLRLKLSFITEVEVATPKLDELETGSSDSVQDEIIIHEDFELKEQINSEINSLVKEADIMLLSDNDKQMIDDEDNFEKLEASQMDEEMQNGNVFLESESVETNEVLVDDEQIKDHTETNGFDIDIEDSIREDIVQDLENLEHKEEDFKEEIIMTPPILCESNSESVFVESMEVTSGTMVDQALLDDVKFLEDQMRENMELEQDKYCDSMTDSLVQDKEESTNTMQIYITETDSPDIVPQLPPTINDNENAECLESIGIAVDSPEEDAINSLTKTDEILSKENGNDSVLPKTSQTVYSNKSEDLNDTQLMIAGFLLGTDSNTEL